MPSFSAVAGFGRQGLANDYLLSRSLHVLVEHSLRNGVQLHRAGITVEAEAEGHNLKASQLSLEILGKILTN